MQATLRAAPGGARSVDDGGRVDELRRPLFVVALILVVLTVLVELGAGATLRAKAADSADLVTVMRDDLGITDADEQIDFLRRMRELDDNDDPPGLAIPYLALVDGLLLFVVGLIGISLVVPERVQGRVQGVVTLIVSIIVIVLGVVLLIAAVLALLLMVSLFLSVPFGTLTYLAVFGFFDRPGATTALALVLALKLGFTVCLLLAHQRFAQNKGLVLLVVTSLVMNLVVSFLHGLVPLFLVSITDAIAAIVVSVVAIVWAVVLLLGAIVSIVKVLRLSRGGGVTEDRERIPSGTTG